MLKQPINCHMISACLNGDRIIEQKQKKYFLDGEGDNYYRRNAEQLEDIEKFGDDDPLLSVIIDTRLKPESVLEIGCANGWRLARLKRMFPDSRMVGVDPSADALAAGRALFSEIELHQGTADALPVSDTFDLVILGFCLYLCDRADLFRITAEADRRVCDGGVLGILDFYTEQPTCRPYSHAPGMFSYKMNYSDLFLCNPAYRSIQQQVCWHPRENTGKLADRLEVCLLRKQLAGAYRIETPDNE